MPLFDVSPQGLGSLKSTPNKCDYSAASLPAPFAATATLPVPSTHAYYSVRRCSLCCCPPALGLVFSKVSPNILIQRINVGLDFLELR
jgi:hypothetical protein